jgi:hypothetical protein
MDDSQESWREDLNTRNDMGQEFSNEETDVRGEIRTPRDPSFFLLHPPVRSNPHHSFVVLLLLVSPSP